MIYMVEKTDIYCFSCLTRELFHVAVGGVIHVFVCFEVEVVQNLLTFDDASAFQASL